MNWWKTFFVGAAAIILLAAPPAAAQGDEKIKVTFGIHFESSAGQSSAQLFDMTKGVLNILKENYGVEVVMKTFPSQDAVEEAFLKNEIDAAVFLSGNVVSVTEKGAGIHPWITFHVKKRKKMSLCLWSKKGKEIKNISELQGKRLIQGNEIGTDWLLYLRDHLYKNGVDKPLWQVFSSFTSVPSSNSAFMSLAAGEGDCFWQAGDYETILKLIAPNLATQVSYSLCSDSVLARGGLVLNTKTLSKTELKKLDDTFKNFLKDFNELAKKDTGIKTVKQYMNLAQARIVPARPDEFDYEIKLFKEARKRGWIAEAEMISGRMEKAPKGKPVEIKPDFDYCQKSCAPGKNQMACMDKCME